jgi:hypothetical protein
MRHNLLSLIFSLMPLAAFAAPLIVRRRWSFVAGACLVAAIVMLIAFGTSAAFVAATLGVLAWFWDERTRLRPLALEAERERLRASEEASNEDLDEIDDMNAEAFDDEHETRGD